MTIPLVIVGAGGFGRETLDVVEAINASSSGQQFDLIGIVDDSPSEESLRRIAVRGVAWLGGVVPWLESGRGAQYLLGIGSPSVRRAIDEQFLQQGAIAATAIHPRAGIGSMHSVASGTVVCAGAQVSTNVTLGRHAHINPNATIGHDTVLEDFVSVNPGAVISGEVVVGADSLIGAGSVILQGLRIGRASIVGAASCVTRDVPPHSIVKGIPAK